MVRDPFLKCQTYRGTYLGGLTEDIWILSPSGPKRGGEEPRHSSGGKRPQRPQTPLPSPAAHLLSPPRSCRQSPGLSSFPWQLWAHTTTLAAGLSQFSRACTRTRRPHAHQHPSPRLRRPGSPTRGLRTHKGRSLGLAGCGIPAGILLQSEK